MSSFVEQKNELIEKYTQAANSASSSYNDVSHQLNNALMTASLAYMGVVAAVLGNQSEAFNFDCCQRILIKLSLILLLASIVVGAASHVCSMNMFRAVRDTYVKTRGGIKQAADVAEVERAQTASGQIYEKYKDDKNGIILSWVQVATFGVGTLLSLLFIFSLI